MNGRPGGVAPLLTTHRVSGTPGQPWPVVLCDEDGLRADVPVKLACDASKRIFLPTPGGVTSTGTLTFFFYLENQAVTPQGCRPLWNPRES